MIIPVRCMSCGKVIGDKWEQFQELTEEGTSQKAAMDQLGIERYCCRTVFLTHVDALEDVLQYKIG